MVTKKYKSFTVQTNIGRGFLTLVGLAALYFFGGYAADWLFPESEWATEWRYSFEQNLDGARYVYEKRPHNCEFLSAPLGGKHCHYERLVTTVRVRGTQTGRQVSDDDGRTWRDADPDAKAMVLVSWNKVED